ncbi:50S ribosomal protein L25 [candidate division WOR-3 bacterium]|nr:50S ribosomal protein L25 [candidate division WOR-3 bacterium]
MKAKDRTELGSRKVNHLRKEGWIPGIIYGHGEKSRPIMIKEEELKNVLHSLHSEATLLNLDYEGKKLQVLMREVSRNPLNEKLLHVDFQHIHENEEVSVHVILELQGKAKGIEEGGILNLEHRALIVRCLPKDIPEKIVVDVSNLEIGQSIHIKDLQIPEGVKVEEDPSSTIVNILSPRKLIEVKPAEEEIAIGEEAEEPEVIAKEGEEVVKKAEEQKEKESAE